MYLDFGTGRGRIRFTWKEFTAVVALAVGTIGHIVRTEVQFVSVNDSLHKCEKRVTDLEELTKKVLQMPGGNNGEGTSGPPPF